MRERTVITEEDTPATLQGESKPLTCQSAFKHDLDLRKGTGLRVLLGRCPAGLLSAGMFTTRGSDGASVQTQRVLRTMAQWRGGAP